MKIVAFTFLLHVFECIQKCTGILPTNRNAAQRSSAGGPSQILDDVFCISWNCFKSGIELESGLGVPLVVPRLIIVFSASNMTVRCPFLAEQAEPIAVPLLKIGLVVSFHCYSESLCALSPSQSLSLSLSVSLSLSLSLYGTQTHMLCTSIHIDIFCKPEF